MSTESVTDPGNEYICVPVVFNLITPTSDRIPVTVDLVYTPNDPYVVEASFRTGVQGDVCWALSRDLLTEGMNFAVGDGDVRVRPAPDNSATLELELSSPNGRAVFAVCAHQVADFLRQTYAAVPPGAEFTGIDVDRALAELLGP